jgi:preprotein translocase subunit SecY
MGCMGALGFYNVISWIKKRVDRLERSKRIFIYGFFGGLFTGLFFGMIIMMMKMLNTEVELNWLIFSAGMAILILVYGVIQTSKNIKRQQN